MTAQRLFRAVLALAFLLPAGLLSGWQSRTGVGSTAVTTALWASSSSFAAGRIQAERPANGGGLAGSGRPMAPLTLVRTLDWLADSNQSAAKMSESIRAAGDVNGDGYDDVIVGAREYDSGALDSGRAYLYYGSASGLSLAPDVILNPPIVSPYGYFGQKVAGAGDVNGDGYADIMVSMTNYDQVTSDEGAVFVWYGSATGPSSAYDWMARGNSLYAHLGWDLDPAGDVNGDGYDDIIVGAYRYDYNNISHAYVWYGSSTGLGPPGTPANADWFASAPTYGAHGHAFGIAVGGAGDVNGDGYDDVYSGAKLYDNGQVDEGAVFVWHGSVTGLGPAGTPANADWQAESNTAGDKMGWAGPAGDVNNDGYDDFLVGAEGYSNGQTSEGAVYLWLGGSGGLGPAGTPANADWSYESDRTGAQLGLFLYTAGDANADGFDDFIAGAHGYAEDFTTEGAAFVFLGSATGPGAGPDWMMLGGQAGGQLGYSAATAGDVNGDTLADIVVGAPYYDNGSVDEGCGFAFYGAQAIAGLSAAHDGPTALGVATNLSATVSAGMPVSYTWDLGDESAATGSLISHVYASPGVYTATVTAANTLGGQVMTTTVRVEESIGGLTLASSGPTNLGAVTVFTATVTTGTSVSYDWDFGDGGTASGAHVGHVYAAPGDYTVWVTARNAVSSLSASLMVGVWHVTYLPHINQPSGGP